MDPGRDPTAGFFQGWLLSALLTSGALSDPIPIGTVSCMVVMACTFSVVVCHAWTLGTL